MKWLFPLALAGSVVACAPDKATPNLGERLAAEIETAAERKQPLRVADATPFTWERLHVFPPYTPAEEISRDLGFAWPDAKRTRIEERDGVTLLVFVEERRVIEHLNFPRKRGDFSMIVKAGGFTPSEAVFAIQPEGRNPTWWVLRDSQPPR